MGVKKYDTIAKTIDVTYFFAQKDQAQFQLLAGAYSESNNPSYYADQSAIDNYFLPIVKNNLNTAMDRMPTDYEWDNFDYHAELLSRNVSYIVLLPQKNDVLYKTVNDVYDKFRLDPLFSLVFINEEVAIYRVN